MFKNMIVYRIGPGWTATLTQLEEALVKSRFVECGASQEKSVGWIAPRGEEHGPLAESVGGQWVLKLMLESKAVPSSVINRKARDRAAEIEALTGRKPGKKETRELKEDAKQALLPMAFSKQSSVQVWIDPVAGTLAIDAGSQAKADEVVTQLIKAFDGLVLLQLNTQLTPATAMATWLTTQEAPAGFAVDRECELKATDESKAVVRYSNHPLDTDEVRQHIEAGKMPTRLALTWEGRVSLVLTDNLQIKKLAFLDGVFEGTSTEKEDGFDADTAIATGELRKLIPDLLAALGGEVALGASGATAAADTTDAPF